MTIKRYIFLTFCTIVLLKSPSLSQTFKKDVLLYENKILKSYYQGDNYKLYKNIENLLLIYPAHPVSTLYYSNPVELSDIMGFTRVNNTLNKMIKKIGKDNTSHKNLLTLKLELELEKLYSMYNLKEIKKFSSRFNSIKRWIIIGPYNKYGRGDFNYPFVPEIISDYTGIPAEKLAIHKTAYNGIVNLKKFIYPDYGTVYAVTSLKIKNPVKLRIYSESNYKVFINGREILSNQKYKSFSNLRIVKVWDTKKITLMLKIHNEYLNNFRVIITDDKNRIIKPQLDLKKIHLSNFKFSEEMDFPYKILKDRIKSWKNDEDLKRLMGRYFMELNSNKSITYFKKSLLNKQDYITSFLLAGELINESESKSSANYLEGWEIMNRINNEAEDFVPAAVNNLRKLIESRNIIQAFNKGKKIIELSPDNQSVYNEFIKLLIYSGYDKETLSYLKKYKEKFPYSIEPLILEAEYFIKHHPVKTEKIYLKILKRKFIKEIVFKLLKIYNTKDKHIQSLELINKYNHNKDFTNQMIDALIEIKKFDRAKKTIFRNIIEYEKPSLYYRLGLIDYLNKFNPEIYWQKTLSLNPSLFKFSDRFNYLNTGKILNPFQNYLKKPDPVKNIMQAFFKKDKKSYTFNKKDPSTILHRERIFILQKDNSNRVYCRDIIYLNSQRGVYRWGEIKVPYSGRFQPVRIRVYYRNGKYNNSYRIQKINDEYFINMYSLKKDSILHVSYIIDNPIKNPASTQFVTHPIMTIQDYDEPINSLTIKIIAPEKKKINFMNSKIFNFNKLKNVEKNIYVLEKKNLKSIQYENYIGSHLNSLPYFSFTTMNNHREFTRWYNGLIFQYDRLNPSLVTSKLKGKNIRETVTNVYNYVSQNINLLRNILFMPERAKNILNSKNGTVEDKVILTKAMLNRFGIKSYIAFAKKNSIPGTINNISTEIFSNILLYIPFNASEGIWLDYTAPYYNNGTVDFNISGTNSLVLLKNSFLIKKIESYGDHKKIEKYQISIDNNGNAKFSIINSFSGLYGVMRKNFLDEQYHEDLVISYLTKLLPNINLENYDIVNLKNTSKPFIIKAKGNALGIAIAGSKKLILKPVLNKSDVFKYIRKEKRKFPLFITSPIDENSEYLYRLPVHFKKQALRKNYKISSKFGVAEIIITKTKDSNILLLKKIIKIKKYIIKPSEYKEFVDFCLKINDIENQRIILNR